MVEAREATQGCEEMAVTEAKVDSRYDLTRVARFVTGNELMFHGRWMLKR